MSNDLNRTIWCHPEDYSSLLCLVPLKRFFLYAVNKRIKKELVQYLQWLRDKVKLGTTFIKPKNGYTKWLHKTAYIAHYNCVGKLQRGLAAKGSLNGPAVNTDQESKLLSCIAAYY